MKPWSGQLDKGTEQGGSGRVEMWSLKTETKVCGRAGYAVEYFRMSLGSGDVQVGVLVLHRV